MSRTERLSFFTRVEAIFDSVPLNELSDEALVSSLSAASYAADLALLEVERRGLIEFYDGVPSIPYALPEGVDYIDTILTRPTNRS